MAYMTNFVCVTLVNNVGYSVEYPEYFAEMPHEVSCEEQLVIVSFFDMCQLLFP